MTDLNQSMVDVLFKHNLISQEQSNSIDGIEILRNSSYSITDNTLKSIDFENINISELTKLFYTKQFSTKVMNYIISHKSIASSEEIIEALLSSRMNDYVFQLLAENSNAHDILINIIKKYPSDWDNEDYVFETQACHTISDLIEDLVFTNITLTPELARTIIMSGYTYALSEFSNGIQYEHNYDELKAALVEVMNDKEVLDFILDYSGSDNLISSFTSLEIITEHLITINNVVSIITTSINDKRFTLQFVSEFLIKAGHTELLFKILIRNKLGNTDFVEGFIKEYKSKFSSTKSIMKLSLSEYVELLKCDIIKPEVLFSEKLLNHFNPTYTHIPIKFHQQPAVIEYYLNDISKIAYSSSRFTFVQSIVLDKKLRGIYFKCLSDEIVHEYIHNRSISPVVLDLLIVEYGDRVKPLIDVNKLIGFNK